MTADADVARRQLDNERTKNRGLGLGTWHEQVEVNDLTPELARAQLHSALRDRQPSTSIARVERNCRSNRMSR
jgi:hypothetical protein